MASYPKNILNQYFGQIAGDELIIYTYYSPEWNHNSRQVNIAELRDLIEDGDLVTLTCNKAKIINRDKVEAHIWA